MTASAAVQGLAVALAAWRAGKIAVLSLIVIEGVAQAGEAVRRLISRGKPDDLERPGADYLIGLSVLGPAFLGWAAVGLFRPVPLIATFIVLAAAWFVARPRSMLFDAARAALYRADGRRSGAGVPATGFIALMLGLATSLIWILVPETEIDSYVCHLAAPDQFLKAGRLLIDLVPLSFRISLPADLVNALPLILGDDRIAKVMSMAAFGAVTAVFASGCLKRGETFASWAGPLLAVSSISLLWMLPTTKHDVTAAAMLVCGFILLKRRSYCAGALLLGAGTATKIVYGPIAVMFFLLSLPPGRLILPCLAVMSLPELPWMAKEAMASGNPLYPFGSGLIPTLGWDARNWAVFGLRERAIGVAEMAGFSGLARAWLDYWRADNLLLMLCLPGVLAFSRRRAEAWVVVAGQLAMLWFTRMPRYLLPTAWYLAFLAAESGGVLVRDRWLKPVGSRPGVVARLSRGGVLAFLAAGWMILAASISGSGSADRRKLWGLALSDTDATYRKISSSYSEMTEALRKNHVIRPLVAGDFRTYRLPVRIIYAGAGGETPLIWRIARESRDTARIRTRMKQLGIDQIVFNYVNANWIALYYGGFEWDRRSLRLYVDFCKRYMIMRGMSTTDDYNNGGFLFYGLSSRPVSPVPATVWFAPGTETVYSRLDREMREHNNPAAVLPGFLAIQAEMPDVGYAWNRAGHIYGLLRDYPNGFRMLDRFGREGIAEDINLVIYGAALIQTGRLDQAGPVLERALARYTDRRSLVRLNQASLFMQKAIKEIMLNHGDLAGKYADQGLAYIAEAPENDPRYSMHLQRLDHAFLLAIKASVLKYEGKLGQAIRVADDGLAIITAVSDNPGLADQKFRVTAHAYLLITKAASLEAAGDRKDAGDLYLETLRLYPDDVDAPQWMAGARRCGVTTRNKMHLQFGQK